MSLRGAIEQVKEEGLVFFLSHHLFSLKFYVFRFFKVATIKSRYGIRLRTNFGDRTFRFYVSGKYGNFYWDRLHTISTEFVFLDIGANQGLYTIGAALNPMLVRAYAFEPVGRTFSLLEENVRINDAENRCELVRKGISDKSGSEYINIHENHSGRASLVKENQSESRARQERVELMDHTELQLVVRERTVPIIVKIDVEGLEPVVIKELFKTNFTNQIREIFMEVNEDWVSAADLTSFLRKFGFNKITRVGHGRYYDLLIER